MSEHPQAAGQGKHRIYLSIAPGAGGAHRMVADARARAAQGETVGLGFAEVGRLQQLTEGIGLLPMRASGQDGQPGTTLDVEALRQNPPALAIMGNLAYSYGAGARYPQRREEIQMLLELGCDVYSNLYAYELEPLAPLYRRLTQLEPPALIPAEVLDQSHVIFVDAEAEAIIAELETGEIMPAERLPLARRTFYRPEVLSELRRATRKLLEIRAASLVGQRRDRLMVCVGYNPSSAWLIRRARQIADGLAADLLAVHIRPPSGGTSGYEVTLQENLAVANEVGAEIVTAEDRDVVGALLEVAHNNGVSALVIGRPERNRWGELLRGSLLTQLINADRSLDIYIVAEPPGDLYR